MQKAVISIQEFKKKKQRRSGSGGGDGEIGKAIAKGIGKRDLAKLIKRFDNPEDERGHRNRALLHVWLDSGLRCAEILRLTYADSFEADDGSMVFRVQVKGASQKKTRHHYVTITDESLKYLKAYHDFSGIESLKFFHSLPLRRLKNQRTELSVRGLYDIVRSWNVKTRGKRQASPHSLRHTVGKMVSDDFGHATAAQLLGHSNVKTTQTYYSDPNVSVKIAGNWRTKIEEAE